MVLPFFLLFNLPCLLSFSSFPQQNLPLPSAITNTSSRMSSNNPFASAMTGEYVHYRDPPPPPRESSSSSSSRSRPPRPPRDTKAAPAPPPPSYEEAAGPKAAAKEYPREKQPSSSSSSSRPHRSHSDSARHRHRHHDKSKRPHKSSSSRHKSLKKTEPHNSEGLDTIDKLDVSAFFGGRFHHDGPFDACTPHRNKNSKAAPVMAFPADGPNNSMKAPTNNDKNSHIYLAFGEGYDQNEIVGSAGPRQQNPGIPKTNKSSGDPQSIYTPQMNPSVTAFDANVKAEPVHGLTTAGLGSSTFLDGAPAPRGDDFLSPPPNGGGLGRKKSLVQRLRKNSGSDVPSSRSSNDADDYRSSFGEEDAQSSSLLRRVRSLKVGRK